MVRSALFTALVACAHGAPPAPPAPANQQTGALEHRMANCPSALPSAVTRVADLPDGVSVTITVEPEEQQDLVVLAKVHARIGQPEGRAIEHSGMHGGPGDQGHCPIIHTATIVRFAVIPGGVRFDVHALPGRDLGDLQRQTRARAASLPRFADR